MAFKKFIIFLFFLGPGIFAFKTVEKSWGGRVYIGQVMANRRFPAAIQKRSDFTHLTGSALILASQEQLLRDAEVISRGDKVGIRLGLFFRLNEDHLAVSACDDYTRIRMEFHAENMAVNGEPPKMTIEAPCMVGEDFQRLAPIWIPVAALDGHPIESKKFPELGDVNFSFSAPSDQLPKNWRLNSVTLETPNKPGQSLEISSDKMKSMKVPLLKLRF